MIDFGEKLNQIDIYLPLELYRMETTGLFLVKECTSKITVILNTRTNWYISRSQYDIALPYALRNGDLNIDFNMKLHCIFVLWMSNTYYIAVTVIYHHFS